MSVTFSATEMLRLVRLHGGLGHQRADCDIEQTDGLSPDTIIAGRLREWYLGLLDTAPLTMLSPTDVADKASIAPVSLGESGSAIITAPENCRRITAVKLSGWHNTAPVLPHSELDHTARLQENPYTRADEYNPVAVALPDRNRVRIWPSLSDAVLPQRIQTLTAVVDPGPEAFTFDESALAGIIRPDNPFFPTLTL